MTLTSDERELLQSFRRLSEMQRGGLLTIAREGVAIRRDAEHPRSRTGQTLLDRLRRAHTCERSERTGFIQQQRTASGVRSWRCEGCGQTVTLPPSD